MQTYNQPIKARARDKVLTHAVRLLTTHRAQSTIVRKQELAAVVKFAVGVLAKMGYRDLTRLITRELDDWLDWRTSRVQHRRADQLRVIYLCGPEPLNDLKVLLRLGVSPHNVWAIESNEIAFQAAVASIAAAAIPVKLHRGPLARFFEQVPESFDIAYLDTTGPILGGKPSAIAPALELLRSSRLEPLSVLITNYAAVPKTDEDRYARVMTEFFRFRYNDVPTVLFAAGVDPAEAEHDAGHMLTAVKSNLESVYSDFITRLLIDVARSWIPSARGLRVIENQYLSDRAVLEAAYALGKPEGDLREMLASIGDVNLSPSSYPLISFLRSIRQAQPAEPLAQSLGNMSFSGRDAFELNKAVELLDKIVEGHWKLASDELLQAIAAPWFDQKAPFTCDLPFPNLMVHSLLGMYGRPYFASLRDSIRGRYTAKATTMFTDVFVLDQCRYYFDWFPTVTQVPARFRSKALQVVARCIMDRIWSSDQSPDTHPYRGSSVAGFHGLRTAPFHSLPKREHWR